MRRALWWLAGAVLLFSAAAIWFLNSGRLQAMARRRVVAKLERVTGGPVTISGFEFDWRKLRFVLSGLRTGSVRVARVEFELRWRSLLARRVDAARVQVERPEINLAAESAGSVPVERAFAIDAGRYDVVGGSIRVEGRKQGFELHGEDLRAELTRDRTRPEYAFHAGSSKVEIVTGCCGTMQAEVQVRGKWAREGITFERWYARARLLRQGEVTSDGTGTFTQTAGLQVQGALRGTVHGIPGHSRFRYTAGELTLNDAVLQLFGGSFRGGATVGSDGNWRFQGRIEGLPVNQAAGALGWRALPWNALASGPVSGTKAAGVRGDLWLAGRISGDLHFSGDEQRGVEFRDSDLRLPHSRVEFAGSKRAGFTVHLETTNLGDLKRAFSVLPNAPRIAEWPELLSGGRASYTGTVKFENREPRIAGRLEMETFRAYRHDWQRLVWQGTAQPARATAEHLELTGKQMRFSGAGHVRLRNWSVFDSSEIEGQGGFALANWAFSIPLKGRITGTAELRGTLAAPAGSAEIELRNGELYGERLRRLTAALDFAGRTVHVLRGTAEDATGDSLQFSGKYADGRLEVRMETARFELSHVSGARGLDGRLTIRAAITADMKNGEIKPVAVNGRVALRKAAFSGEELGNGEAELETAGSQIDVKLRGDLRGRDFAGNATVGLEAGNPVRGSIRFEQLPWRDILPQQLPIDGFLQGSAEFSGKLMDWRHWAIRAHADRVRIRARDVPFALTNMGPVEAEFANGAVALKDMDLVGPDTKLHVAGTASANNLNFSLKGVANLQVVKLLDTNVEDASGQSTIAASIRGTPEKPVLSGSLQIKDGAFRLHNFEDAVTRVNGIVAFSENRATVQKLTAEAGGGKLQFTGFVTFGGGATLAYHLESRAETVRLRYANGISVTMSANLRLTGTSANSLLSGNATISRVVLNPSADAGNLLANVAAMTPVPVNQNAFASSLQLNITIESAPNFQISTALSRDMEASIDLHLRGTPERPVLLGSVTANQGVIRVFGGRYTINRGVITFQNAARIEPVLDLDLQTQVRGITVDLTLAGTPQRFNVAYRSDPPLQPRDIIALLTVGRTPQEAANVQTTQIASDTNVLQANPASIVGQAITPPSGRLSKLFGITNIKLDPLVQGLTSTPQSRLTLEQQISRSITVTYVTNLEQTSEQIFRFEWSLNRQYSIVAVRDDNGEFGIDIQYKKRFK